MADVDDLFDCFDDDQPSDTTAMCPVAEPLKERRPPHSEGDNKDNVNAGEKRKSTGANQTAADDDNSDDLNVKRRKTESILDDISVDALKSRIAVHTIESPDACTHEVAIYPGQEYNPLKVSAAGPAKQYPFVLDPFQREAILCIDNQESVLVSAHTSAGKTVVAEYAIAKSLASKQRVIYTTPIKALSNQKYREFTEEFKDVGLVTGDVTINPSASCLIMTTEILRNMLYRGSEIMREVGWVVFDEIHYMRDKERGVVWEETLILLPDNVRYVFLSATIPNARQFAEWVCHLHKQPCHVVYTDYRPTPLQHYIFPAGGDGIHMVVDEQGNFKEDNFNLAMSTLQNAGEAGKGDQKGRKGGFKGAGIGHSQIHKLVKMIMENDFAPVIIFSFSKKDCELYATQMAKLDFNSKHEKELVDTIFKNALDVLSEDDRSLPQVENCLPLLKRGIGIHHGGLLPILKEVIEILFGEGLIKALFATETFAMGLNMPARTVLFTSPRKFDGRDFRWISSGEYIQMAGRAGRRGLDDKGVAIFMIDEKVTPNVVRSIVQGKADPINSAFHLTYNMVLNLLRVEEINPEYMLERSFFQFQNQASIPGLYNEVQQKQIELDKIKLDDEHNIASYHHIREQLESYSKQFQKWITKDQYLLPYLQPGRLVKIKRNGIEYDWGLVMGRSMGIKSTPDDSSITIDLLLHTDDDDDDMPCKPGQRGNVTIRGVSQKVINKISSIRLYNPKNLTTENSRRTVLKLIQEVKKRFPNGPPLLHPIDDMGIKDEAFKQIVESIKQFEDRLHSHPIYNDPNLNQIYDQYKEKLKILAELNAAKTKLKAARSLLQMDELKQRKRVLRRMEYCTAADVIEFKGRVACELNSADELLLTEMIFNGIFNDLTTGQTVALLSCFVCDEKSSENPTCLEELGGPLRAMQDLARRIVKISNECKLELDEETYIDKFRPYLMDVVLHWCKGSTFSNLCKITDIFEGSIIRCMRRLEELLRQMCQAAKTIGNTDLENKFSEGIRLLKRDIVFAASLYL